MTSHRFGLIDQYILKCQLPSRVFNLERVILHCSVFLCRLIYHVTSRSPELIVFVSFRFIRNKRARDRGFLSFKDAKPKREAGFYFGHLYFRAKELGFDDYKEWKKALRLGFTTFEEWQDAKNNGFYTKREQIDYVAKGFSNYEIFVDTLQKQLNQITRLNNQLLALVINVSAEDYSRDKDPIQDLEELKNKIMEIEPLYNSFEDSSELSTRNWILNRTVKLERERSEELRRKALFFFEEKMWDAIK